MKEVTHDDRYYVDLEGFDNIQNALLYAGILQINGDHRSIPIYQHGKIVRMKRF